MSAVISSSTTSVLSLEALSQIADNIISDYSGYIRNQTPADSVRSSIGYQIDLLRGYSPTHDCESVVVLPKSAKVVDISILLRVHGGLGRYFLTIRPETEGKYAVHQNKLYYVNYLSPSKPFDVEKFTVSNEFLQIPTDKASRSTPPLVARTTIESGRRDVVTQTRSTTTKSSKSVAHSASVISTRVKGVTPIWSSKTKSKISITPTNLPEKITLACPRNNNHCCYANHKHPQGECVDVTKECCINEPHIRIHS